MQKPNVVFVSQKIQSDSALDSFLVMEKLSRNNKIYFLLEGFEEWDGTSPYSYVGVDPFETLIVRDGLLEMHGRQKRTTLEGEPFTNIKNYFKKFRCDEPKIGEGVFRGGAIGFIGFESAKYFEKALLPFMKKYVDERVEACLMVFKNTIGVAHDGSHLLLTGSIFLDEESLETGKVRVERELRDLANLILSGSFKKRLVLEKLAAQKITGDKLPVSSLFGQKVFESKVKQIKDHIKAGDIFQCVLSDQFEIQLEVSPLKVYEILRFSNPSPFMFYLSTGTETIFGASPERLVKVANQIIETNPIAGTRPRGKNPKEDKRNQKQLLASTKERAEHLMLVDLGRNDIGRVAKAGSVKVHEFMEVKRFSDVMHLISKVKGRLDSDLSPWDALGSCFPAGTLSGSPKIRALEIISKLETTPRFFYGGVIVKYEFDGSLDSCIAIRSACHQGSTYTFQAGAGIVADSNPTREYNEVLAKTRALRRALFIAQDNK
jgi:anthranilate synthase component 1